MRILYLHQYFTIPEMPGGTRSYEMARRLVVAGHEVVMVTSSAFLPSAWTPTGGWHVHEVAGIEVHALRMDYSNRTSFRARIAKFAEFAVRSRCRCRVLDYDIVFATSTPLTIAIPGVLASRDRGVPLVFEVRDLWPEIPVAIGAIRNPLAIRAARRLESWAYRNSASVVALSSGMAAGVARTGYPADLITVIPNACDPEVFALPAEAGTGFRQKHGWLGTRPLILYPGTLGQINGVGFLVDVAREMVSRDPEIRFLIIGDGKEREAVLATARQAGVLDRSLFMLPPIAKYELAEAFSAADLIVSLVIPIQALEANSANKFFDGLAAGRAVGINYGGWQAEVLRSTGAGIRFDSSNAGKAADELLLFLRDPERCRAANLAAGSLAETAYNRDALAAKLEQTLSEAARRYGAP